MNTNCKKLVCEFQDKVWTVKVLRENFIAVQVPVECDIHDIPINTFIMCRSINVLVFATVSVSDLDTDEFSLAFVLAPLQKYFINKQGIKMTIKDGLLTSSRLLFSPPIPPYTNLLFKRVITSMIKCRASLNVTIKTLADLEKKNSNLF